MVIEKILNILMVDDDEEEFLLLRNLVSQSSPHRGLLRFNLDWAATYQEAVKAFDKDTYDIYLVDYRLGGQNGLDLLQEASIRNCSAPIIILTGQGNYEVDLAAMQSGAADYLNKSQLSLPLLERSIRYALEHAQARIDLERLVEERTQELVKAKEELEARVHERTAELRQRNEELQSLNQAASVLLTTLDLDDLLPKILDTVQHALPASERGWLHLVAPETGKLRNYASSSFTDSRIRKVRFPTSSDYPALVARDKRPLLIKDVPGNGIREKDLLDMPAIRSLIAAPLLLGDEVIGVISLGSSTPEAFTQSNLDLLVTFSAVISTAIHNAMLHAEVQRMATIDALTGAYNRRSLEALGQREVERFERFGHPLTAIMLDIDNFKSINDVYGHATGDRVLIAIVERCRAVLRKIDIMGRYGGDEFVILLPETDLSMAFEIARRIHQSASAEPVPGNNGLIYFSVSMGLASAEDSPSTLDALFERADKALYAAKQRGKNRVESTSQPEQPVEPPTSPQ